MNATPTLESLQSAFQDFLLADDEGAEGTAIAAEVIAGHGIGVARRLGIYHHAYRARLVDTLRDSHGHLAAYLGDDWFERDALDFVAAHPSHHDNLRWYGAAFASWLHERHPQDRDIAELAALDWALRLAFDGPDAPVATLADLAAVAPEDWAHLGLQFHPTCARLQLGFNTLALWQALDRDETPPTAAPLARPTQLLIWRQAQSPHFRSLDAFEAGALDELRGGASFAATCEAQAQRFPATDVVAEMGRLLRRWIEEGLLAGFSLPLQRDAARGARRRPDLRWAAAAPAPTNRRCRSLRRRGSRSRRRRRAPSRPSRCGRAARRGHRPARRD